MTGRQQPQGSDDAGEPSANVSVRLGSGESRNDVPEAYGSAEPNGDGDPDPVKPREKVSVRFSSGGATKNVPGLHGPAALREGKV